MGKSNVDKNVPLICPICGKSFIQTEEHKYRVREGLACSWKCFLERVKEVDEKMENVFVKIKLSKISDLYEFVKSVQSIRNKVVARQGLYQVDAGSVLGLCCLDLVNDFVVSIPAASAYLVEKWVKHEE